MKTKNIIQAEALAAIADMTVSGVEISMGVGKSLLGIKHMAKNYTDINRYLVASPKIKAFDSWKDDLKTFGYGYLEDQIDFTTYRSLTKQSLDYDYIYLDECHSLKYNHAPWLDRFLAKGGKIIGLTGTYPVKLNSEKGNMCLQYCPKVYTYLTDEAIDDEILNDYHIYVHMLQLSNVNNLDINTKDGNHFKTSELKSYAYWTKRLEQATSNHELSLLRINRMSFLKGLDSKVKYAKLLLDSRTEKTIVFANTKKQADQLCEHRYYSGYTASEENLKMFNEGTINKLSAVEQLNESVNIPGLKCGIILHAYGNNRKAKQKLGRLLRLKPNEKAVVHILCYVNSVDKDWVSESLRHLDQTKIDWITPLYYLGTHY